MEPAEYDHLQMVAMPDPFPLVNDLREQSPVFHSDAHGGFWVASRYADIRDLAFDTEQFSFASGVSIPAFELPWKFLPVECDPPIARDYRKILNKRSSPGAVAGLEDVVRATVVELIDEFAADGAADLAQRLFIPAAAVGLAHFLGLEPDRERWHGWASRVVGLNPDPASLPEIMAYFDEIYAERTEQPRDDLPSDLRRLPDFAVEHDGVVQYGGITRGVETLPVTFTPAAGS